jgi:pimeloyl-ACP methyl ester carboxylesterase
MLAESDLRAHLGRMRAPTLVLHRGEDTLVPVASGRRLAQSIPRARFVELSGRGNLSFVGEVDELVDEVEEFLTGGRLGGNGLAAKGFPGPRCSRSHPLMLGWPRQRR